MRLLLDEMWPPDIAEQLRRRGHDVVAVAERPDLRGQPDGAVFDTAQLEQRTVVTENVPDYRPLAAELLRGGGSHHGLIFTSDRTFPRGEDRTAGRLVSALGQLLDAGGDLVDREHWLA